MGSYPDAYTHTNPVGDASPVAYHALKGGTIHMTRHMACYWASTNERTVIKKPGVTFLIAGQLTSIHERTVALGQCYSSKRAVK